MHGKLGHGTHVDEYLPKLVSCTMITIDIYLSLFVLLDTRVISN